MLVTDTKIPVTTGMMQERGMLKYGNGVLGYEYGIPVDIKDLNKGLIWKTFEDLEDGDFDVLEEYFLLI